MAGEIVTVQDALRQGAERLALREDLREFAREDAQQLLEMATGRSRVQMLARPEAPVSSTEQDQFRSLLERRLAAVPVQYLRGSQEFYGRDFKVTPDVLIPRPETEDIVTAVLEHVPDRHGNFTIADVGTGSGALAVTLALELPGSQVTAIDISEPALQVARRNAELLGQRYDASLSGRIRFRHSDLFQAFAPEDRFDIIVSNPPYVPLVESASLHPQVREHEPHLALFGGEDGHDIYRRLLASARSRLFANGLIVLETPGHANVLRVLLNGWSNVTLRPDLLGRPRVIVATRP